MNANEICASVSPTLPGLFQCAPTTKGAVRIRTPLLYPDGGVVDVFVEERHGNYVVTDFGDALGWLGQQSVSARRTQKQQLLVEDVCQTLRLELSQGQLTRPDVTLASLASAVIEVAQAVVRVSDIWFTMRSQSLQTTADEVDDWLREMHIEFARRVQIQGRSTRSWTIDFKTYVEGQTSLVYLLSTGARGAVHRQVENALAGWVDLNHLRQSRNGFAFVSLFNDLEDVWRSEDFRLLETHSKIAMWSRPDELQHILAVH